MRNIYKLPTEPIVLDDFQKTLRQQYIEWLIKYPNMSFPEFAIKLRDFEGQTAHCSSSYHAKKMRDLGLDYPYRANGTPKEFTTEDDFIQRGFARPVYVEEPQIKEEYHPVWVDEITVDPPQGVRAFKVNGLPFHIFATIPEEAIEHYKFLTNYPTPKKST